jgi:HSP20 family molecular chaperone IbpA
MATIRWEPFRKIASSQQQINQIFDRMMTATDRDRQSHGTSFIPAAEIHETDSPYSVRTNALRPNAFRNARHRQIH